MKILQHLQKYKAKYKKIKIIYQIQLMVLKVKYKVYIMQIKILMNK